MAKRQKPDVEVSVNGKTIDMTKIARLVAKKDYEITGATIKDDFCNYTFKILVGQLEGETGSHNGPLIISDDLRNAFQRLRVHLAVIDDAFSVVGVEDIDDERDNQISDRYDVTGFKIKGADENIQVSLIGSKYLSSVSGRMSCATPYILLDAGTDYKWYNELLEDLRTCQTEVAFYKEGKGMRPEEPEEKPKVRQAKITDADQQQTPEKSETSE